MEQARGAASPDYAAILHNRAVLDYQDGKLEQAAPRFHGALQIRQAVLGEKDPITAQTLNSLAAVYARQRRYAEAERLGLRALAIEAQAWGPGDPRLVPTLDNLIFLHVQHRRLGVALELTGRAYGIVLKTYGDRHPLTAQRMNHRAVVLAHLGRYPESRELLLPAIEIKRVLDYAGEVGRAPPAQPDCSRRFGRRKRKSSWRKIQPRTVYECT
jgi:tetratricopeptide (TPR) repeat protein